jgi:hypothetical protein
MTKANLQNLNKNVREKVVIYFSDKYGIEGQRAALSQ